MTKKLLAVLLALAMVLALVPTVAFATDSSMDTDALYNALWAGGEVTLDGDITVTKNLWLPRDTTLDLGGNTLTLEAGLSLGVYNGATVTIKNGTIEQKETAGGASGAIQLGANNGGATLNVENATIKGDNGITVWYTSTLNVNDGAEIIGRGFGIASNGADMTAHTININGGSVTGGDEACGVYLPSGTLNVNGGTVTGGAGIVVRGGTLNVTGGTVTATASGEEIEVGDAGEKTKAAAIVKSEKYGSSTITITGGTFNTDVSEFLDEQNFTQDEEGNVVLVEDSQYVAQVGTTYYKSLQAAVQAAPAGSTVVVLKDCGGTSRINAARSITIDLNGYTFTRTGTDATNNHAVLVNGKNVTLTITDSSENGTGTITRENGTNVVEVRGGQLVLESGNIVGAVYAVGVFDGGTVTVNGGSISADIAISTNGSKTQNTGDTTININGGTIKGVYKTTDDSGVGIYNAGDGTVNVTGGTVTGQVGIFMRAGELNVSGGTIKSERIGSEGYVVVPTNSKIPFAAVVIAKTTGYDDSNLKANLTGGTFTTDAGDPTVIYLENDQEVEDTDNTVSITGGTYQSGGKADEKVLPLLDDGFTLNQKGTVIVETAKIVAAPLAEGTAVKDYDIKIQDYTLTNGFVNVIVTAHDLAKSTATTGENAYWLGVSFVPADQTITNVKYGYSTDVGEASKMPYTAEVLEDDVDGEGSKGLAFYVNAEDYIGKTLVVYIAWDGVNATRYNIQFKNVTLAAEFTTEVTKAPLADDSYATDYDVTENTEDGTYTLTATDVLEHENGNGDLGYWVGVRFIPVNEDGATPATVTYSVNGGESKTENYDGDGLNIYIDAAKYESDTLTVTVQWDGGEVETFVINLNVELHEHAYGPVTWDFSNAQIIESDKTSWEVTGVTGTRTCTECGHEETVEPDKVTYTVQVAPTCEETGRAYYTVWFEGLTSSFSPFEIPALGHDWDVENIEWTWADDYSSATATFTCLRDDAHTVTEDAEVTEKVVDATCLRAGKITYTATVTLDDVTYTDTKSETVEKLTHEWHAEFDWTGFDPETMTGVTAHMVCSLCLSTIKAETVTVVESEVVAATCEESGKIVYTATAKWRDTTLPEYQFDPATDTLEVENENDPATGHKYVTTVETAPLADPSYAEEYGYEDGTLTALNLKLHENGAGTPGYWVGLRFLAETLCGHDATEVTFSIAVGAKTDDTQTFEYTGEGLSLYFDAASFAEGGANYGKSLFITIQWNNGEVEEYEIEVNVTLEHIHSFETTVAAAPQAGDYADTYEFDPETSTLTAKNVKSHVNGAGQEGYWVGVAFTVKCGTDGETPEKVSFSYNFDGGETVETVNDIPVEDINGEKGLALYFDAAEFPEGTTVTLNVTIKWDNGEEETYSIIFDVTLHEHTYGEPEFTWSEDNTSATATFTCTDCGETETVDATVTPDVAKEATCTEDGEATYTATVEFEGEPYTETKSDIIEATGHDWEDEWTWADDGSLAYVIFTCRNDDTHTGLVTVGKDEITSEVTKEATCEEDGTTTYSATVEFDGQTFEGSTEVANLPATGHAYGEPKWTWSTDGKSATATFTCANDATHTVTETAEITSEVTKDATCTQKGETTYTATVEFEGKTYTATKVVADINALGHTYGEPEWTWSEDGKSATAKFTCAVCGDEQTRNATVTGTVTTAPTCEEMGTTTYTATVSFNGATYTDTKEVVDVEATGHDWDTKARSIVWAWNEDNTAATATFTCKTDSTHTLTLDATVKSDVTKEATCAETGTAIYTATVELEGRTYSTSKTVVIPAETCPSEDFVDLQDKDAWFHDYADYVIKRGIMQGDYDNEGNRTFRPEDTLTRAEVATILWNLAGKPTADVENPFTDLTEGWYDDAILWAYSVGIVNGYGDGTFGPQDAITLNQLAAMIYRFAQYKELIEKDESESDLENAIAWCTEKGIIDESIFSFDGEAEATRAQATTMIVIFDRDVIGE